MSNESLHDWLRALSDRTPTPGGGGAAALQAATAAALVSMVANYTTGQKWSDREEQMVDVQAQAARHVDRSLELIREDGEAFATVGQAYGLPRESDEQKALRKERIQAALKTAAEPPLGIGAVAVEILELCRVLAEKGNPSVISDVAVAAYGAAAALDSAATNVDVNAGLLTDAGEREALAARAASLHEHAVHARAVGDTVREGLRK